MTTFMKSLNSHFKPDLVPMDFVDVLVSIAKVSHTVVIFVPLMKALLNSISISPLEILEVDPLRP